MSGSSPEKTNSKAAAGSIKLSSSVSVGSATKTPLAMLKGRPGSLSVPSFSFRFNPSEEDELEEVEEVAVEVGRDVARERANSSPPSPPPATQPRQPNMSPTTFRMAMLKGKRTFSLDGDSPPEVVTAAGNGGGGAGAATSSSTTSDTWSIFSELKEKIARTVEERFRIDLHSSSAGGSNASSGSSKSGSSDKDEVVKENIVNEGKDKSEKRRSIDLTTTPETVRRSASDTVISEADVQLRKRRIFVPDPAPPDGGVDKFFEAASFVVEPRNRDSFTTTDQELSTETCWTTQPLGSSSLPDEGGQPRQVDDQLSGLAQCRFLPPLVRRWIRPMAPFKQTLSVIGLLLLSYQFLPVPPFLDGLLTGVVVTGSVIWTWHWFTRARSSQGLPGEPVVDPASLLLHSSSKTSGNIRKVWMNEFLGTYSPEDFHIGHTHSVLVRLEGSTLRISYSKSPVPKRSMWNEATPKQVFIHQRHYDLCGAKLSILPEGLAKRRHWSRRYPICVEVKQFSKPADPTSPPHLLKENENLVVLFARSGREKEEWYWRLEAATGKRAYGTTDSSSSSSTGAAGSGAASKLLLNYGVYMARLIPSPVRESSPIVHSLSSGGGAPLSVATSGSSTDSYTPPISPKKEPPASAPSSSSSSLVADGSLNLEGRFQNVAWVNAILGRCFWDFLREAQWADRVRQRIQRKLTTIKVPYFIEELRVSDIELGSQLPQVTSISSPVIDERGLWVDVGVSYYGALRMTLATKLNLMRLKKMTVGGGGSSSTTDALDGLSDAQSVGTDVSTSKYFSSFYDSEADESVESSSDEEGDTFTRGGDVTSAAADLDVGGTAGNGTATPSQAGRRTSRTLLRLVDTIAQSRYFQHATEYKYIKKAMEGVSNTPLVLTVELLTLSGTVAVNIPPPPSDRLWYGFRGNPQLSLVAKPKVGEREVQFTHIVEWIEKKLVLEFQRFLVLPNMDDLIIPIANSGIVQFSTPRDDSPQTPPFDHKP